MQYIVPVASKLLCNYRGIAVVKPLVIQHLTLTLFHAVGDKFIHLLQIKKSAVYKYLNGFKTRKLGDYLLLTVRNGNRGEYAQRGQ